jgi:hypothetical protein
VAARRQREAVKRDTSATFLVEVYDRPRSSLRGILSPVGPLLEQNENRVKLDGKEDHTMHSFSLTAITPNRQKIVMQL